MIEYYIPDNIVVGYKTTKTENNPRLAYITYKDELGKLKFETSWNKWRDVKVPEENYDNDIIKSLKVVDTAGGYKSGWNYRQEYIQLSDNRGFMFQITTDNFLWLLDYCICDHGVLKGEFSLAWITNTLYLIPVQSDEYKAAKQYSDQRQNKRITKVSEMIPGRYYRLRNYSEYKNNDYNNRINEFLFIGSLPTIQSDNSRKSRLTFVSSKKDGFFFTDIKGVEYETSQNTEDVSEYIELFIHSPYSPEFWQNRNKLILVPSDKKLSRNSWKLIPFNTYLNEDGTLWTYKFNDEDCYNDKAYYCYRYDFDYKGRNKSFIEFGNIKGDFEFPLRIRGRNSSETSNYINESPFSTKEKEQVYRKLIKNKFNTPEYWKQYLEYEKSHESTIYREEKAYNCILDGYEFPISEFLVDGFFFGYDGEFSVNSKYSFPTKIQDELV